MPVEVYNLYQELEFKRLWGVTREELKEQIEILLNKEKHGE